MTTEGPFDPSSELRELVRAARAFVEQHQAAGADGLLVEGDPAALLAELDGAARPRRPAPQGPRPPTLERAEPARSAGRPPEAPPRAAAPPAARLSASAPTSEAGAFGARLAPEERLRRLSVLADTVRSCTRCGLAATRKNTVFSRGNPEAELVFVGEGPGADEDAQGLPFVGRAGQLLDKMIGAMGLGPDDVYICNIVKCRPPENRTPEAMEMATCMPYLAEQLEVVQPKVLVALGSTALRGLLGSNEGITKARGTWKLYRGSIPVMPTFHPAYVLRQPTREVKGAVWSDLQQVLRHLGRPLPKRGG